MSGLLDLKTNLKSLKFGNDRFNGGSSNHPYIIYPIPENYGSINKFDDGFIRGGIFQSTKSSITDTLRISKFFIDFPKGPLFLTKQIGLQLSNPKIETKPFNTINNPNNFITKTINKGIDIINKNGIGPTRIYNLGINTLAQVSSNNLGTHYERHGISPIQDENTKYYSVVKNKTTDENRLVQLKNRLIPRNENVIITKKDTRKLNKLSLDNQQDYLKIKYDQQNSIIDKYIGGPNSTYGIGSTIIRRYDYTPKQFEVSKYI